MRVCYKYSQVHILTLSVGSRHRGGSIGPPVWPDNSNIGELKNIEERFVFVPVKSSQFTFTVRAIYQSNAPCNLNLAFSKFRNFPKEKISCWPVVNFIKCKSDKRGEERTQWGPGSRTTGWDNSLPAGTIISLPLSRGGFFLCFQ